MVKILMSKKHAPDRTRPAALAPAGRTAKNILPTAMQAQAGAQGGALVDFSDQITKIYRQGASMAQLIFEQPRGRHHTFEQRDEMRRDRIRGRY